MERIKIRFARSEQINGVLHTTKWEVEGKLLSQLSEREQQDLFRMEYLLNSVTNLRVHLSVE